MWNLLLLSLSCTSVPCSPARDVEFAHVAQQQKDDPEFERRRKEAGNDVDKLWDVYKWCKEQKKDEKGRSVLRQLLRVDPNHEDANVALGHVKYDGKWFPSQKKADEYKKEQEAKQAKADGLVDYKGQRVRPEDVPFLEKGLVKDEAGNWVNADDYKKRSEGWIRQDLEWVPPQEKENIEKGLWKVGDKWLTLEEANKAHSELDNWWRIPSENYWLYTTCDREVAIDKVKRHLDQAWDDVVRITGFAPKTAPIVVILRDRDQYNTYANGDPDIGLNSPDLTGMSSLHYAFFAETAGDPATGGGLMHVGVGYWDASSAEGNSWGPHSARSAFALSCVDALDPSPAAIEKALKAGRADNAFFANYYGEKKLPVWFRTAIVGYVERYYVDRLVASDGNARWAKEWSVENLVKQGGIRPLKQLFDLDQEQRGDGTPKTLNELGLVMSFIVDGKCDPVTEKLTALKNALKEGKAKKSEIEQLVDALAQEVIKQETALRKYANI